MPTNSDDGGRCPPYSEMVGNAHPTKTRRSIMSAKRESPRRRIVRMVIAGVLAATCVRVWFGPEVVLPRALAQIPDSGMQRKQLIDEVKHTHRLLEQIHHTLKTQTIKVRMEGTDKTKTKAAVPRPTKP